jgi:hypothetical protein
MFCKVWICFIQSLLICIIQRGLASEVVHSVKYRELQMLGNLTIKGNNLAPGTLLACEGDCEKDVDCKAGLKCFQRNSNETVPGCTNDKPNYAGTDFCYSPPVPAPAPVAVPVPVVVPTPVALPPLKFVGNNGAVGLLSECEGDCDRDTECKTGLKCFQRTGLQAVPGCSGGLPEWTGFDFCYKPPAPVPVPVTPPVATPARGTLKYVGNNRGPGFPLNACEGDCDSDSQCKSGLKCLQRRGSEAVPGCTGDKPEWRGYDFCYKA